MSDKLDPTLRAQLAAAADAPVDLIVRTADRPAPYTARCAALGVEIRYTYNLLPGLAVTASGATALRLADEPWVVSIELDRTVRAL